MAYARAVKQFFDWCDRRKLELGEIDPLSVAAYIEQLGAEVSVDLSRRKRGNEGYGRQKGGASIPCPRCRQSEIESRQPRKDRECSDLPGTTIVVALSRFAQKTIVSPHERTKTRLKSAYRPLFASSKCNALVFVLPSNFKIFKDETKSVYPLQSGNIYASVGHSSITIPAKSQQ
jgi:hypothetical protein